jgi:tetratricopeptide (TPR) repeat protein
MTANGQLLCQARKTFSQKDNLCVFFQVLGISRELRAQGKIQLTVYRKEAEFLNQTKGISEYGAGPDIVEELPLAKFPPDYYKIKVSLLDGTGKPLLSTDDDFEVSALATLPRPVVVSKVMSASHAEEYDYTLGTQMLNLGRDKDAYALLEKAYEKNPAQLKYALGFSQSVYTLKEYQRVKDILNPFVGGEQGLDQVFYLLGKSCQALGQYAEAVPYYRIYLSRFGANLEIINLLGMAYYRVGNSAEALAAWRKSLEINPNQEEIKKLIDSLPKK